MRHTFRLPVSGSPEISVDHSQITGLRVSVDGEPVPRLRQGGRPAYAIRMTDGSIHQVRFAGQLTGLQAVVDDDGTTIELERKLSLWELVLTVLPFGLIGVFGPVGGVVGLSAILVNLRIARLAWPTAARVAAAVACLVVAFVASSILASVLPPVA